MEASHQKVELAGAVSRRASPNRELMPLRLAVYPVEVIFWLQLSSGLRLWIVDLAWLSITMCLVLLKHVSSPGWGLEARGSLGMTRTILVVGRQVSLRQSEIWRGLRPGHCWCDCLCIKYCYRHLSDSHALSPSPSPSAANPPFSSSIPHLSFPRLLLCNELPLFTN